MEDKSIYFIESQERVVELKDKPDFLALINGSTACTAFFTSAEQYHATSKGYALKLEKSSKAFTVAGIETRVAAATLFSVTASVVSAFGMQTGGIESSGIIKYTKSRLLRGTIDEQADDCNYILSVIDANKTALEAYNINAVFILKLQAMLAKLIDVGKMPQDVIKQHAVDNKLYIAHEKMTKKFYDKEMDPFMEFYKLDNMEFYLSYRAARQVRHHHLKRNPPVPDPETTTGILELLLLFKDSMEPAAGVSFVVASLNISEISDAEGETYNDEIVPGTYSGKLSMEGYTDIDFEFTIVAGETTAMQFLMEVAV